MKKLSLAGLRILMGLNLGQLIFFSANYYFFHFFEPYDRQALTASALLLMILLGLFVPSSNDFRVREQKKRSAGT